MSECVPHIHLLGISAKILRDENLTGGLRAMEVAQWWCTLKVPATTCSMVAHAQGVRYSLLNGSACPRCQVQPTTQEQKKLSDKIVD